MVSEMGVGAEVMAGVADYANRRIAELKAENERLRPNAELGALVRRMPIGAELKFEAEGEYFVCRPPRDEADRDCWQSSTAASPEAALRAALGEEKDAVG